MDWRVRKETRVHRVYIWATKEGHSTFRRRGDSQYFSEPSRDSGCAVAPPGRLRQRHRRAGKHFTRDIEWARGYRPPWSVVRNGESRKRGYFSEAQLVSSIDQRTDAP